MGPIIRILWITGSTDTWATTVSDEPSSSVSDDRWTTVSDVPSSSVSDDRWTTVSDDRSTTVDSVRSTTNNEDRSSTNIEDRPMRLPSVDREQIRLDRPSTAVQYVEPFVPTTLEPVEEPRCPLEFVSFLLAHRVVEVPTDERE